MKLSDTDFPREVRERMQQVLLPGDEILWAESTVVSARKRLRNTGGICALLFAIFWTSVPLYLTWKALSQNASMVERLVEASPPFLLAALGLFFICAAGSPLFCSSRHYYAVSRYFLLCDQSGVLESFPLTPAWIMECTNLTRSGRGDLLIKHHGDEAPKINLSGISSPALLARILKSHTPPPVPAPKQRQSIAGMTEHLSTTERAGLQQTLGDEAILWLGKEYVRKIGKWFPACFSLLLLWSLLLPLNAEPTEENILLLCLGWAAWGVTALCLYLRYRRRKNTIYVITDSRVGSFSPGGRAEFFPMETVFLRRIVSDSREILKLELNRLSIQNQIQPRSLLPELMYALQQAQQHDLSSGSAEAVK